MIDKKSGDQFGAAISFYHEGPAISVDVGWAVHAGEKYVWAVGFNRLIDEHLTKTQITLGCAGIFDVPSGIGVGQKLSAQAVVCPAGKLEFYPGIADDLGYPLRPIWTAKMDSTFWEVGALLWTNKIPDAYRVAEEPAEPVAILSGISVSPT